MAYSITDRPEVSTYDLNDIFIIFDTENGVTSWIKANNMRGNRMYGYSTGSPDAATRYRGLLPLEDDLYIQTLGARADVWRYTADIWVLAHDWHPSKTYTSVNDPGDFMNNLGLDNYVDNTAYVLGDFFHDIINGKLYGPYDDTLLGFTLTIGGGGYTHLRGSQVFTGTGLPHLTMTDPVHGDVFKLILSAERTLIYTYDGPRYDAEGSVLRADKLESGWGDFKELEPSSWTNGLVLPIQDDTIYKTGSFYLKRPEYDLYGPYVENAVDTAAAWQYSTKQRLRGIDSAAIIPDWVMGIEYNELGAMVFYEGVMHRLIETHTADQWYPTRWFTFGVFLGATETEDGTIGLVPQPTATDVSEGLRFLGADGLWHVVVSGGGGGASDFAVMDVLNNDTLHDLTGSVLVALDGQAIIFGTN